MVHVPSNKEWTGENAGGGNQRIERTQKTHDTKKYRA